jgi:antitoxin VapB
MAFHVRDPKTDALVREVARRRGIGITEAIREIAEEALTAEEGVRETGDELRKKLQPLFDKVDAMPRTGERADKQFFDELWGQGDE